MTSIQEERQKKVTVSNPAIYQPGNLEEYDRDTLYNIISWHERENERIREQSHELLRHHVRVIGKLLDEIAELEIR